jgi:two-component system, sensor histidine kinase and response regulator
LTVAIDEGVPFAVKGDRARIRQVAVNLVSNAVKFTADGEVVVTVSAKETDTDRPVVRVEVSDTGIGIDPDRTAELFEPFSQADRSTTRKFGGTGLGLTISKQLVDMMGGEIGAEGRLGQGSTFWFSIPLERRAGPSRENDELVPDIDLQGVRVLIVDDNPTNRRVLIGHAAGWGLRTDAAADAEQALALMTKAARGRDPYEVAVVDHQMPGMDGAELARMVKADEALKDVVLVMLSSSGETLDEADENLFVAHIRKPVRCARLHDAILRATRRQPGATRSETATRQDVVPAMPVESRPAGAGARLLVAEDNAVNQVVVARMLEKHGYSADIVPDGRKALEALARDRYAAVLMDCHMPEVDGYEATRRLRQQEGDRRHTPVIAMTASAMEGDREKCIAMGMDDYVSKPLAPGDVMAVLERWVGRPGGVEVVVDRTMLDDIGRRMGGDAGAALTNDLVSLFLRDTPVRIAAISSAVDAADPVALRGAAHALRGSTGALGAVRMAELCAALEEIGAAGSVDGAAPLAVALQKAFDVTKQTLEDRLELERGGP